MACNQTRTPERPVVFDVPRVPKACQTLGHQVSANHDPWELTPIPRPRPETQQGFSSPTGFGHTHPLPSGNASFLRSDDRQNSRCHIGGCYETRSHEHKDEGIFFQYSQEPLEEGGFRTFLGSINNDHAGFSQQASQIDSAVLPPVNHENSRDLPLALGMPPTQLLNNQDNESFEAFSARLEHTDETEKAGTTEEVSGARLIVFRLRPPFPEPEQESRHRPQIMYAGPARPEQCTSPTCPIREIHGVGLYVHDSQWGLWPNDTFGISNPPDYIWAAYARSLADHASPADLEIIRQFVINHDRPYPGAQKRVLEQRRVVG